MIQITELGDLHNCKEDHKVNCPYCDNTNELTIDVTKPTKKIYVHPPDYNPDIVSSYNIFSKISPEKMSEKKISCSKCNESFHVALFPYNIDDVNKQSLFYRYYKILFEGSKEKINHKPFFVDFFDMYFKELFKFLGVKNPEPPLNSLWDLIGCIIFVTTLSPTFIFGFLLGILTMLSYLLKANQYIQGIGVLSLLFYAFILYTDKRTILAIPFLSLIAFCYVMPNYAADAIILFIFTTLTLFLFRRHLYMLSKFMEPENLPIALHNEYKKRNDYFLYLETLLNLHPYNTRQKFFNKNITISNATLTGFTLIIIFVLLPLIILLTIIGFNMQSSYLSILGIDLGVIIVTLYFSIFTFMFGNILWVSLPGMTRLFYYVAKFPLKINLLKQHGGLEVFGKLYFSSIELLISLIFIIISIPIFDYIKTQYLINHNVIDTVSNIYRLQVSALTFYIFPILYLLLILASSVFPILVIHNRIKKAKESKLNDILNNIDSNEKSGDYVQNMYLLEIYDRIDNINDWPIKLSFVNTMVSIFILIVIPVITALIPTLLSSIHMSL